MSGTALSPAPISPFTSPAELNQLMPERIRVLLDEGVPEKLRTVFSDALEVETVRYLGWTDLSQSELIRHTLDYDAGRRRAPLRSVTVTVTVSSMLRVCHKQRHLCASCLVPRKNRFPRASTASSSFDPLVVNRMLVIQRRRVRGQLRACTCNFGRSPGD